MLTAGALPLLAFILLPAFSNWSSRPDTDDIRTGYRCGRGQYLPEKYKEGKCIFQKKSERPVHQRPGQQTRQPGQLWVWLTKNNKEKQWLFISRFLHGRLLLNINPYLILNFSSSNLKLGSVTSPRIPWKKNWFLQQDKKGYISRKWWPQSYLLCLLIFFILAIIVNSQIIKFVWSQSVMRVIDWPMSQNKITDAAFVIECHGFGFFCLKPLKTI